MVYYGILKVGPSRQWDLSDLGPRCQETDVAVGPKCLNTKIWTVFRFMDLQVCKFKDL